MKEFILGVGALAGAVLCIFNLLFFIWRPLNRYIKGRKAVDEEQAHDIRSIKKTLELHTAHLHENYMHLLRSDIYSENLPLVERVNAGHKYIKNGGNGSGQVQHEENVQSFKAGQKTQAPGEAG